MRATRTWAAAAVAAGAMAACTARAGWEYTLTTKSESGNKRAKPTQMLIRAWVDGDKARVEFLEGGGTGMSKGTFLVTTDAGKVAYLVNPTEKTYMKWDAEGLAGMGGMMQAMGMKFSAPKVEKLVEERGEKILGYATTHYRFRTSYTMDMNFMGFAQSSAVVNEEDIWATTELKDPGMGMWLKKREFKTGDKELDALIAAEVSKAKGMPLKRLAKNTSKDNRGNEQVTTTVMEVTELKQATPAASLFELPGGYTERAMPQMPGPGAGGGASRGSGPRRPAGE